MDCLKHIATYETHGIDYDLFTCLEYNPQDFTVGNIEAVVAVFEEEKNAGNWHWIIKLNNDEYVALEGDCDYGGWDCQSWAQSAHFARPDDALEYFNDTHVKASLRAQLNTSKIRTWHEQTGIDFGLL